MAKKQKKNDPYAICTAQKKKSGMGHDAWKRCVQQLQQKESVMNFYEKVKLLEKRTKRNEKMQNKLPDGPPQAGKTPSETDDEELDRSDTTIADDNGEREPTDQELGAIEKEEDDEKESGAARIAAQYKAYKARQNRESKKGMKEGGAYGLGTGDPDDEDEFNYERDIPAHIRGKAAAKVRHERELELAKQRQEKDPDDDEDRPINASKKRKKVKEKKLAEWKPKTYHTIPGEDETDAKDPKDMTPAEKAALEAEYEKGKKEKDAEHAAWMADIEKRKKEKEGAVNASKKSKVGEAKKGKKDDKWIQKAVDPDHEGYCTPMTKKTCTPARKALAKTFKKMGRARDRKIKAKDEK